MTSVAIVTPVHNRREITLQCLRSLERIDTREIRVHTIVVDDGSSDGTAEEIAKHFPQVQVIAGDGNLWFSEGTNVGVREALRRGVDYVLMMNDDQVFDSGFLLHLVDTAKNNPRSVVGPLLLLWDTPHRLFQTSPKWETLSGGWRHWQNQTVWTIPDRPWKVEAIVGNCVLVPTAAIKEHGMLDSKRYPNFGDAEYTPRLRRAGWQLIIDPRSRVFCQPNYIPRKVLKMSLSEKVNALFFDLKHVHNLRRRLSGYVDGAPSKLQGVVAFGVFFARLIARKNTESATFTEGKAEPSIADTFADKIIR